MVTILEKTYEFNELFPLLEVAFLYNKKENGLNNRCGFPEHKGGVLGITKARYKGFIGLSYISKKNPILHNEAFRIGKKYCPFEFSAIQINKNLTCTPHTDKHNVGDSMLVSFGDYEGSNIIVDGKEYSAKDQPLIFNGSELEHYNTKQLSGTKYSLVFYKDIYSKQ